MPRRIKKYKPIKIPQEPTVFEKLEDALPYWVPRVRFNIYLDFWSVLGLGLLGLLILFSLGVAIF